jgi:hypothetical protein
MDTHEGLTQHDGGHSGANAAECCTAAAIVAREDLDEPLPHLLQLYTGQRATRNVQHTTMPHATREHAPCNMQRHAEHRRAFLFAATVRAAYVAMQRSNACSVRNGAACGMRPTSGILFAEPQRKIVAPAATAAHTRRRCSHRRSCTYLRSSPSQPRRRSVAHTSGGASPAVAAVALLAAPCCYY